MKRVIKSLLISFVLILLVLVPNQVLAGYDSLYYLVVGDTDSLATKELSLSDIYIAPTEEDIRFTGVLENLVSSKVDYEIAIALYDVNFQSILEIKTSDFIEANSKEDYTFIIPISKLMEGFSVSDIFYSTIYLNTTMEEEEENNMLLPSQNSMYAYKDYVIDKYDVNIVVNKNNTFDITETITAYFNSPKHGIFRKIPISNNVTRTDGSTSKVRAQVLNLDVNAKYTTKVEDGYYVVQIGDANVTLTGTHEYVIKYTYNLGKDPNKDFDELYYNIIGTEWDTYIGNVTFTITMPEDFDESKLGFSHGSKGSTESTYLVYSVDNRTISGQYVHVLDMYEGVTVRLELPDEYFVGAGFVIDPLTYLMFAVPLIVLIVSFILWFLYGRDDPVVETVEFYPPDNMNSLEVGYIYKGKAEGADVVSLLIYLANKGYIKISEVENKSIFSRGKDFKITKIKDYDGNNSEERVFFKALFASSSKKKVKNMSSGIDVTVYDANSSSIEVTTNDLYDRFYKTVNRIISDVNDKENKYRIYEKSTMPKTIAMIILAVLAFVTILGIPAYLYGGLGGLAMVVFLALFYSPFYIVGLTQGMPIGVRVFWLGFVMFHSGAFFAFSPLGEALISESILLHGFIFGILCILGTIICIKVMPKRTKFGSELYGKVLGFKRFLETAEKEKLEAMVESNPSYFYDILPYTYVLGISNKWIKRFEKITMRAPDWYDSPNAFDVAHFGSFMNSTMSSASRAMTSSPSSGGSGGSSSGGGGSSGGGSSGGGSGGGGGGSW